MKSYTVRLDENMVHTLELIKDHIKTKFNQEAFVEALNFYFTGVDRIIKLEKENSELKAIIRYLEDK